MTFLERYNLTKRFHWHIDKKATGTPEQMAEKLGIRKTALYDYLNILKGFGAEIGYCRTRQTFYYKENFEFPC